MAKGISVKKSEDISQWYTEVITKSDLVDYSDVSGCIIFKPGSYAIWEIVRDETDKLFKEAGIQNCYFPLFIPEKFLTREAEHVEGFAPEVAWVTQTGSSTLSERLAVRPTSETIMYPSFAKWIRSHRDLPLRLNQWNNVVRWEFKNPVPLMRSREFLWNEGHTAFATKEEAEAERDVILGIYQKILKDYMGIYGSVGYKSEREHFAGAEYTCSIECFLESGKAIQGPDFHHDGQIFAKAFDIQFVDENEQKQYVWQNTFAITTRMLGVMFMMHGDDKGLILPPPVAPIQAVIVPIYKDDTKDAVIRAAAGVHEQLFDVRSKVDDRDGYSPGWKFNEHELKGVPLRIEIGPKDLEQNQVTLVRRDTGEKIPVDFEHVHKRVQDVLSDVHGSLYQRSMKNFEDSVVKCSTYDELKDATANKKIAYAPFCNEIEPEDAIKEETQGVKTMNSPFGAECKEGEVCVYTGKPAKRWFYFGKAY
ncbi:proline--tRNA ligase [Candidatus Woesearchaeota archaeon]|nr:proline--tRNA ligase [Candidatus Woesearchaeota archaeon]